jgi:hypothetical protein
MNSPPPQEAAHYSLQAKPIKVWAQVSTGEPDWCGKAAKLGPFDTTGAGTLKKFLFTPAPFGSAERLLIAGTRAIPFILR